MLLDLDRQPAGRSWLDVDVEFPEAGLRDGPREIGLRGRLPVDNLAGRVVINGTLQGRCRGECDRCLVEFELAYPVPVSILVLRDGGEDEEPDAWVIHQRTGEVDLTGALREAALLGIPQKRICREACQGLCARCGADLNRETCDCDTEEIDPRWEGLPDL